MEFNNNETNNGNTSNVVDLRLRVGITMGETKRNNFAVVPIPELEYGQETSLTGAHSSRFDAS